MLIVNISNLPEIGTYHMHMNVNLHRNKGVLNSNLNQVLGNVFSISINHAEKPRHNVQFVMYENVW